MESRKVIVAVILLILAARIASCDCRLNQVYPDHSNYVLFAPKLEVPLSADLTFRSGRQSCPGRVDVHCFTDCKSSVPPVSLPGSPWIILLVNCGDVEANPGPARGAQLPYRRCDKAPSFTIVHLKVVGKAKVPKSNLPNFWCSC